MPLTPVTFQDFHGGIADLYIGTDVTRQEVLNNFLIDETRKPYVRNGTSIFPTKLPVVTGSVKPTGIYLGPAPFSHPLAILGPHAYTLDEDSNWTEVTGFNTSFLPSKTDATYESAVMWRRQLVAAAPKDSLPPSLIYCTNFVTPADTTNKAAYKAVTAGLPPVNRAGIAGSGGAANYLYALYYKYTYVDNLGTIFSFLSNPLLKQASGFTAPDSAAISIAFTVLSNTSLTNYDVKPSVQVSTAYTVGSSTALVSSSSGIFLGSQVLSPSAAPGTVVTKISGTTITLSLPATATFAEVSTYSQLTVQFYRTINGGTVLFYCGQVANDSGPFSDTVSDATLQTNQVIYTSGGALGYDPPPTNVVAITQTNDTFWYATATTLYQSIQGAPGACPSSNSNQIDQKIIGLSDIISFPILFCDKSVYRVEGTFDSFGNNGFSLREISKTAGCVSNRSIVKTPYGLIWFGNGGIYWTDGYNVKKITRHLNISYQTWSSKECVGEYEPTRNMVYWTINSREPNQTSTSAILVLHLAYGLEEEAVFSIVESEHNIYPSSLSFSLSQDIYDAGIPYSQLYSRMLLTDERGYLLWFDPNSLTDVKIDTLLTPSAMAKKTIIYDLTTAGLDQGVAGFRKYTPDISVEIDAATSVAMQIKHRRDDGSGWSGDGGSPPSGKGATGSPGGGSNGNPGVPEIRQDGPITWGITDCSWLNDPDEHPWDSFATVTGKRSVPAGQIRSGRRQLKFTNSYTNIANSDQLGTCTVTPYSPSVMPTVSLDDTTKIWITDPEGYWITFSEDGYNQTYEIIRRLSNNLLQLSDPYSLLTAGSKKWVIKGFRKFERPRLLNFTLYAEVEGPTYGQATPPVGGNA